jgi:hypothetical protein
MSNGPARACVRPHRPPNGNKTTKLGYHRPIKFDRDMIKRAGDAMRQAWCNDVYKLAALALSAAIRTENDLLDLLPPRADPRSAAYREAGGHAAHLSSSG